MNPLAFVRIILLSAVLAITSPNVIPVVPVTGYTIYVVQNGDTLPAIARQFNTTTDNLEQINHLTAADALTPGMKIEVPAPRVAAASPTSANPASRSNALTYTVKAGDTLNAIATSFGVSVADLASANRLANVDSLTVGQVLLIPGKTNGLPDGLAILPPVVKQGNTVEFKITASNVVSVTGSFANRPLHFAQKDGVLFALAGISRCAKPASYSATVNLTTADGQTTSSAFSIKVNATDYPVQDITLTSQMASLLDPAIEIAENNRVANTVTPFSSDALWNGAFQSPLAVKNPIISAQFGTRRSYNGGAVGLCGHEGQDFAVDGGTPVYAPAGGVVVIAEPLKVRGNVVFINHGQGVYSGFYHLSEIDVKNGQTVKTGDLLGKVGTTGFSTGNHLHWSLWVPAGVPDPGLESRQDVYVDPIEWTNRAIP